MILPCKCENKYQDEKYGKGNRVYNLCKAKSSGQKRYRCSVCKDEKER